MLSLFSSPYWSFIYFLWWGAYSNLPFFLLLAYTWVVKVIYVFWIQVMYQIWRYFKKVMEMEMKFWCKNLKSVVFLKYAFSINSFVFIWKEETQGQVKTFHLLVYSSNACNSLSWARPKPGIQSRSPMWVPGFNHLSHYLYFPGCALAGS